MASLVDPDGVVALSPSKLAQLECPRQGKYWLDQGDSGYGLAAVVGLAAHAVLAAIAYREWRCDPFTELPDLAARALRNEWARHPLPEDHYEQERLNLTDLLRRFLHEWQPPDGRKQVPELSAKLVDPEGAIRICGRLDLLLPPVEDDGAAVVIDWKSGAVPLVEEDSVPLPVIGQAALARSRLGVKAFVIVKWVYLRTASERVWRLEQRALAAGWERVRELAACIIVDYWPARPGPRCASCPVTECEHAVGIPNADDLGLVEGEDS